MIYDFVFVKWVSIVKDKNKHGLRREESQPKKMKIRYSIKSVHFLWRLE